MMTKILIVQTAFIGDVILITPLIRAAKELYPDSNLDVMVVPAAAGLLKYNPRIRQVLRFDKKRRFNLFKMLRKLRGQRYDLVISPHSSFTTHLLLGLSGIPVRIGYARGFMSSLLMTIRVPHPKAIHKINKNLSLLRPLTTRQFPMQTELFPSAQERDAAQALLQELGQVEKHLIAIAPGSIWETKCWPVEYYKELAASLLNEGNRLILTGGESDRTKCEDILGHCKQAVPGAAVINTAGRSDLLTSAALLESAELLICNDSGALHIANAVQTRVFAFFGPTVKGIGYYPFREGDIVLETDLDCRPCGSHGGNKCPLGHHNCMREITPDRVLETVRSALRNN